MGKLTGFMEYERHEPPGRDPKARVRDWLEFHDHLPETTLKEQGARCMDCGVPFCHTGTVLAGMASGCPINNLIPEWNDLVYRDQWKDALERLQISGMTVTEVRGHGKQKGHTAIYRGQEYNVSLLPKMEIEVVVPDSMADDAIKAIVTAARTGEIGDCRVFVMPVQESYRIRTGERES